MRQIKFRAWNKKKQQMCAVLSMDFWDPTQTGEHIELCACQLVHKGKVEVVVDENMELMQFTGMLDKNGKELFEGDIVEIEDATAKVVSWERPPEFGLDFSHNEEKWCADWNLADDSEQMAIIGNVYEHQSLLDSD